MARRGCQLGNVARRSAGGLNTLRSKNARISGASASQLKSPISTAWRASCASSPRKASCESRAPRPRERWAIITVKPSREPLKRAHSTPRPRTGPGSG